MTEHLGLPAPQARDRIARGVSRWPILALPILVVLLSVITFIGVPQEDSTAVVSLIGLSLLFGLAAPISSAGVTPVASGEALVLRLLGRYTESARILRGDRDAQPVVNAGTLRP